MSDAALSQFRRSMIERERRAAIVSRSLKTLLVIAFAVAMYWVHI